MLAFCLVASQCEKEVNSNVVETNKEALDEAEYDKKAKFILDAADKIYAEITSPNSKLVSGELNQATTDYYLELVGLEKGSMSSEGVNKIIAEVNKSKDENFVESSSYSEFTKSNLNKIYDGNVISDLSSLEGFSNLKRGEKHILILSNSLLKELKIRHDYDQEDGIFSKKKRSLLEGLVGAATIGGAIGSGIGGAIGYGVHGTKEGAETGAAIGGYIGSAVGIVVYTVDYSIDYFSNK